MSQATKTMRADLKQRTDAAPDVSPLLGVWVNVEPNTDYVVEVRAEERQGRLYVRLFGADDGPPIDWGEVEATPCVTTGKLRAMGFHTAFTFDGVHTEIAANEKLGVLVIQSYTRFSDGSGRPSHFAREFFCRRPEATP